MVDIKDNTELVEPEDLIPYANNPKEHPEKQVDKIASSIKNYGFVQPIVTDAENEVIIGHGRLEAAKKLGLEQVPVIKNADLTDSEAKALRLADNRIAESEMDNEALAVEIEQLTDQDNFEELVTGFEEQEIDDLVNWDEVDEEDIEDAFGDIPEGERDPFQQMTFTLHDRQKETVDDALKLAKDQGEFDSTENENSNGNALHHIAERFYEDN